ncbi:MAG: hypothetical protein DRJ07_00185 [Bacteroidetes bacterium]|nr:MAG: hypothetical protein DRJ07_00185 [Bacteroidota bacterium]
MKKAFFILFTCCAAIMFTSCEGPMGPAGTDGVDGLAGSDGTDGVDGNVTCLVCHSGDNMQAVKEQFYQSVHYAGEVAVDYAGGNAGWGCAQCHSSEGFIEFATNGSVGENISSPSAWECQTCHSLHTTFEADDYALRLAEPIDFIYDETVTADFGNSNLCANCHQSRTAEPNTASPGATFEITSTHYGPHHGAQSNVLYGTGFAEISGSIAYPTAGSGNHMAEAGRCTGCHMSTYGNGQGGHTWNPALDACNDCHGASDTDFNYGGVQTSTETQLDELRDMLVGLGVVEQAVEDVYELNPETGVIELVTTVGGYHPVPGTYPMLQVQAFFNWIGLEEDRSFGAHNPKYVKALLTNSIEALTPVK